MAGSKFQYLQWREAGYQHDGPACCYPLAARASLLYMENLVHTSHITPSEPTGDSMLFPGIFCLDFTSFQGKAGQGRVAGVTTNRLARRSALPRALNVIYHPAYPEIHITVSRSDSSLGDLFCSLAHPILRITKSGSEPRQVGAEC